MLILREFRNLFNIFMNGCLKNDWNDLLGTLREIFLLYLLRF